MKKVLIAADEVDKWSQLCEGLKNEWVRSCGMKIKLLLLKDWR